MSARSFELRAFDPGEPLPAGSTLRDALEALDRRRATIFALAGSGGLRPLLARDLRLAHQEQRDPREPVAELARDELIFTDEVAARAHLADAPTDEAVLVLGGPGACRALEVDVPPIEAAVVMAGGRGTRLMPLTRATPKPLLDVGGRVLLFRIFDRLRDGGVRRVYVSIHHLGEKIVEAVDGGEEWGFELRFLEEERPLDTGAGLAMLRSIEEPFLVMNGDLLTDLDLGALARAHALAGNLATVATYLFPAPLPYGVVHREGLAIDHIEEKPVLRYPINAGVYAFAPEVLDLVPHGEPLPMVQFLNTQSRAGRRVGCFPIVEYWNDVGTHEAFARAQAEVPAP